MRKKTQGRTMQKEKIFHSAGYLVNFQGKPK